MPEEYDVSLSAALLTIAFCANNATHQMMTESDVFEAFSYFEETLMKQLKERSWKKRKTNAGLP